MIISPIDITTLFKDIPILRSHELEKSGIHRSILSRYVAEGKIKRLRRGLYCLPDYRQTEYGDLAIVTKQIPEALVCLLSALRFHELTSQSPHEIWIALDRKAHTPKLESPELRIVRFGSASLAEGFEIQVLEGVPVRITSIEKTIVDCFKYRTKIGLDVALEALRVAITKKLLNRDELWRFAKIDRVTSVILPYLEALIPYKVYP